MLAEFVDRANVGMVERGGGARLAAEALQRLRIATQFFRQELQRHLPAQLEVLGTIDHAHAAAPDDIQHTIVRDRPAGKRSRLRPPRFGLSERITVIAGGFHPFHRYHEPIASAGEGLDVLRLVRRVAQCAPEILDGGVDAVVKLDNSVVGPQLLPDLFAGDDFASALDQYPQDLQRLFL